ncbi:Nascent polypeptide-associated complex subunit alpha, muscle-specific form [Rhizoctonia solani]|uniref:Nascent polypeptide-associated complex subunit alpha, muscle-specific form n=1 Tax=Rhizoctonia solani TaxID=456999 RepID=A0A8H8NQ14_9AGAM|nr:Nascent polypeptide-associated complex subunit alpha, muscle-specific form [Rhizoctonia solani]QRW16500.1 Nascent polypeptide-associated complex subunit alpha, muscle-specific form [Rhizoctonia solani]
MSPSGDGRPVSIRSLRQTDTASSLRFTAPVPQPERRDAEPRAALVVVSGSRGSVYSRDSYRDRGSRASSAMGYANGGGSVIGHGGGGGGGGGGNIELAMCFRMWTGLAYLEDERRMNGSVGHEYG